MARISRDPYTWHSTSLGSAGKPGMVYDGLDEFNLPAKFRLVKHVNAVTVVSGHCAVLAAVPTDGTYIVTNDVTGGTTTPLVSAGTTSIAAGAYCCVPAENEYCFILVEGWHTNLLGDGSVAIGEAITAKYADGTWDTATSTIPVAGYAVTVDGGSPTVFTGFVRV